MKADPVLSGRLGSPSFWAIGAGVVALLLGLPLVVIFLTSFLALNGSAWEFVGAAGYRALGNGGQLLGLLTLVLRASLVAVLATSVALVPAYRTSRLPAGRRALVSAVAVLPFFCSDAVRAFAWSHLLSQTGMVTRGISAMLGIEQQGYRFSEAAHVLTQVSATLPLAFLLTLAAWVGIDPNIRIAARRLGRTSWSRLLVVELPLASPAILVGFVAQVVLATFSSVEEQYVGSSTSIQKLAGDLLASSINTGANPFSALSTLIVLSLLVLALATSALLVGRRGLAAQLARLSSPVLLPFDPSNRALAWGRRISKLIEIVIWVVSAFLLFAPLVGGLIFCAGGWPEPSLAVLLLNIEAIASDSQIADALVNSALLGTIVGISCALASGMLLGLIWARRRVRVGVLGLLLAGVLAPADSYSLAFLQIAKQTGLPGGWPTVFLGHMSWALPFVATVVLLHYSAIPVPVLRAAIGLEPHNQRLWARVLMPLCRPALISGMLFGFLLSLNELTRTTYLAGRVPLVSREVFGALNSGLIEGNHAVLGAVAIVTLASMLAFALATSSLLFRRWS